MSMRPDPTTDPLTAAIIERSMKDLDFRKRLIADPNATIEQEMGAIAPGVKVKVLEEEANTFVITLPRPPLPMRDLTDEQLQAVSGSGYTGVWICALYFWK